MKDKNKLSIGVSELEDNYHYLKKILNETLDFVNSIGEKDPRTTQFLIKRIRFYLTGREEIEHPKFPIPCNDPECCDIEMMKAIIIGREKERVK